jgi:hypothetical protein
MPNRIPGVGLQDLAKLLTKDYPFMFFRFMEEEANQPLIVCAEVEVLRKNAESCHLADSQLFADDMA